LILLLSGPSGTGKTTLARRLLERHGGSDGRLVASISVTTRSARPGEVDEEDYAFVTEERFTALLSAGELLEHAELYGHCYGTRRAFVEARLAAGVDVLLVLDAAGRRQIARTYAAELVSILILPPSLDELETRLRGRKEESEESTARRLAAARDEVGCRNEYDYVLLNGDLNGTVALLDTILRAERLRRQRPALPGDP